MRILAISDSPKLTTGFGNVAYQIYEGLYKHYEFYAFGMLDPMWDDNRLPYTFYPTEATDLMGLETVRDRIMMCRPDLIWIMLDPGNCLTYYAVIEDMSKILGYMPKILAYLPIEGFPVPYKHIEVIKLIQKHGNVVLWCKSGADRVEEQSGIKLDYIYFGSDHAPFRPYTQQERDKIRQSLMLDDFFICTAVGVNKRTKGFDKLIYVAHYLKFRMERRDIKFYCHTDPLIPVLEGYRLKELAYVYDVEDMFIWKPDSNFKRGNQYAGVERDKKLVLDGTPLTTHEERIEALGNLSFIDRVAGISDCYVDVSQVEGWGLPVGEAMSCGIPTVMVNDYHVRTEVFGTGTLIYEPTPVDTWDTWHIGSRLVGIDPKTVAEHIVWVKEDKSLREIVSKKGVERMNQFKWDDTRAKMLQKVRELG